LVVYRIVVLISSPNTYVIFVRSSAADQYIPPQTAVEIVVSASSMQKIVALTAT
jgi:hypothetical protein